MQSASSSARSFMKPPEPTPEPVKTPKVKREHSFKMRRAMPWVLVIALVGCSGFLFSQYQSAKHKLAAPAASTTVSSATSSLLSKVGKIMVLPKSETPTIATVADVSKLQSQAFFKTAHNGDKVIVYNQEKEAILYRPSTNQIVTVAPISSAPSTSQAGQ